MCVVNENLKMCYTKINEENFTSKLQNIAKTAFKCCIAKIQYSNNKTQVSYFPSIRIPFKIKSLIDFIASISSIKQHYTRCAATSLYGVHFATSVPIPSFMLSGSLGENGRDFAREIKSGFFHLSAPSPTVLHFLMKKM